MTTQSNVCFTFDAACDAAIEMETQIYQNFLNAVRIVKDKAANEILQEAASVRLGIERKLEEAALNRGPSQETILSACHLVNNLNMI